MCPRLLISQHGIGDADQFAHDGDDSEALGFAGLEQALIEAAQGWIVLDYGEACGEQRRADLRPAAADVAFAAHLSAVMVHRREPHQGGDLVAIDGAKFGQFSDEGTCHDIADAGDGLQQILLGTKDRAGGDQLVDGALDPGDLGGEAHADRLRACDGVAARHPP